MDRRLQLKKFHGLTMGYGYGFMSSWVGWYNTYPYPCRPSTPMDPPSSSKKVLGHQYIANPASLPSPPKCIAPLPPSNSLSSIPVTNPLPPVTPLVTTAPPPTVPPPQPPVNPLLPPANPMSTTTSTTEIKAALPTDFSGETKDAI